MGTRNKTPKEKSFGELLDRIRAEHPGDAEIARSTLFFGMLVDRSGFRGIGEFLDAVHGVYENQEPVEARISKKLPLPKTANRLIAGMIPRDRASGLTRRDLLLLSGAAVATAGGAALTTDGGLGFYEAYQQAGNPALTQKERDSLEETCGCRLTEGTVGIISLLGAITIVADVLQRRNRNETDIATPAFEEQLVSVLRGTCTFVPAYLDWLKEQSPGPSR